MNLGRVAPCLYRIELPWVVVRWAPEICDRGGDRDVEERVQGLCDQTMLLLPCLQGGVHVHVHERAVEEERRLTYVNVL